MRAAPTTIALVNQFCPAAIDFVDAGAPQDRTQFQPGIAAHAILQALGEETNRRGEVLSYDAMQSVSRRVAHKLISVGRSFEGSPEPPMRPTDAFLGRDVALDYVAPRPLEPGALYEVGVAVDDHWESCDYHGGAEERVVLSADGEPIDVEYPPWSPYFRTILDRVRLEETDDGQECTVWDLKSAWSTGRDRLDHLQQRAQAVMAWKVYEPDLIRRRVVNLRIGAEYTDELRPAWEEDLERLEEWRQDIDTALAALAEQEPGQRPFRPGPNCYGCWFLTQCDHGKWYAVDTSPDHASQESLYLAWADARALEKALRSLAMIRFDGEPIEVDQGETVYRCSCGWLSSPGPEEEFHDCESGGTLEPIKVGPIYRIGHQRQDRSELAPDAYDVLCDAWGEFGEVDESVRSLVRQALTSTTAAKAILRTLVDAEKLTRDESTALLERITVPSGAKRFQAVKL